MRRFGLISLLLHATLLAVLVLRFQRTPTLTPAEDETATGAIELVMLEQQGDPEPTPPPPQPAPPVATPVPPVPPAVPPAPPAPPTPTLPVARVEAEPVPLPSPTPMPPAPPPVPPPAPPAPVVQQPAAGLTVSLRGNSDANALVIGPNVIPAKIDAKSRNRPPVYPTEAARRGEQGSVLVRAHVSPEGLPLDVDVEQSSGFALLDRTARDTVAGWRFVPAVKDGRAIPSDMLFQIVFALD